MMIRKIAAASALSLCLATNAIGADDDEVINSINEGMEFYQDGGKMVRIGRQKAIVKYTSEDQSGELQMVVANRFLVTVEGNGVSHDELLDYARAIDTKKMADMP